MKITKDILWLFDVLAGITAAPATPRPRRKPAAAKTTPAQQLQLGLAFTAAAQPVRDSAPAV